MNELITFHGKALSEDASFKMSMDIVFPKSKQDHETYQQLINSFQVSFRCSFLKLAPFIHILYIFIVKFNFRRARSGSHVVFRGRHGG
jgi:hypothetical protein